MQENRAYFLDKANSSQQNPPPPFPVVVMAVPAGNAKVIAMLPDLQGLSSGLAVIIFEYGQPREDALTGSHHGSLAARLQKTTDGQVQLAGEAMAVEKGKIFIIPAGAGIQISEERFEFSPAINPATDPYLPDHLLARVAYFWGDRVIAVLISDETSAGFTGCRVVREEGGFAFLLANRQHSGDGFGEAEASGCIDDQFPPAQLASRLLSLVDYPVFANRLKKNMAADKTSLGRIYRLLQHQSGLNFSVCRQSDIVARIVRRMALTKINEPAAYAACLEKDQYEGSHLCRDLLMAEAGVMFEPLLGQMLEREVMTRILGGRKGHQPFRIWITGCFVGELAFAVAIRISEYLETRSPGLALQVFATGLNRRAVERARGGLHHVSKHVREMCIFATHLPMADPPFSHIDLIITDNIMAYLPDNERRNVSQSFHYALNAGGLLVVRGGMPAPGLRADLFEPVQNLSGIYMRKEAPASSLSHATFTQALSNAEKEADKILMSSYVPPGMLVDEELRVLRFYGLASPYLKRPGDRPSLHLLKIVRDEILFELSELLGQVDRSRQPATRGGIFLADNGVGTEIAIEVIPIFFAERKWRLIVLREKEMSRHREGHNDGPSLSDEGGRRIAALESQLQRARHQLRSAHKLFNDTQENLQSLYKEVQAANEELQSVNIELQSVNEELVAANEGLKMAEQLKDEFIAIACHELKTPATSIQVYAQILYEELQRSGDAGSARIVERLNVQVNHLSHLTRDLLDITRVSHGQLALEEGWFDIGQLVDEVVEDIGRTTSIRIVTGEIQRDLWIWGDRERITQVLVNLLSNAIKYSPESAEINIYMHASGDTLQLVVQDFGIGISIDTLEKVFDRFYRSNDPSVLQRPGLGLGLYITAEIVRRHGGSITVNSEKGKGSVFTVTLPIGKRE